MAILSFFELAGWTKAEPMVLKVRQCTKCLGLGNKYFTIETFVSGNSSTFEKVL